MSLTRIVRYTKGFLTIRVEGFNLEKFLNMSIAHGITFWDVKKLGMTVLEFKTSISGYRSLKKVIKKTGCKATIIDKDGLPFIFLKIKRRKMLGIGFGISILLLFMLSSFIWSVKITGINTISTEEVKNNLSELGVKPGAFKLDLSVSDIENNMLIRMGKISWIKVKLKGTRAEIEIKERTVPPKIVPETKPCSIVAKRDGIITKIVSAKGDVTVNQGDPVRKGQILVTGIIERPNIATRYVHSSAKVEARTWYEGKVVVPLEIIRKVRNGNKMIKINLAIGSKVFNIKNPSIYYKSYDKIEKSAKLIDTEKFQLPLEIIIEEYFETADRTVALTPEQAKMDAYDTVEKNVINSIPSDAKIINKKINVEVKDNLVIGTALFETIEDIGMQEEIKIGGEA